MATGVYAPYISAKLREGGLMVVRRHTRDGVYTTQSGMNSVLVGAVVVGSKASEKVLIDMAAEILGKDERWDLQRTSDNHLYVSRKRA